MMKRKAACLLLLALVTVSLSALPKIAVLDIMIPEGVNTAIVTPATESVMEELVMSKFFTVLDRAYIDQVLREMEFQVSSLANDTQAAEIGGYLGADFVVTGRAQNVGTTWFFVAKMIEVKTGVITIQASERAEGDLVVLMDLGHTVGKKLASGGVAISSSGDSPAAVVPSALPAVSQAAAPAGKLKVGFIFGGGMTGPKWNDVPLPPEAARLSLQKKYGEWLETVILEKTVNEDFNPVIDRLVGAGCRLIFIVEEWAYEGVHKESIERAAKRYPDVYFMGYRGDRSAISNVGAYWFRDNHKLWYLVGLAAGALTKSNKIGLLEGFDKYGNVCINLFALGVRATNPRAVVYHKDLIPSDYFEWDRVKPHVGDLIKSGCDVFGPTDMIPIFDVIRDSSTLSKKLYSFSWVGAWESWGEILAGTGWYDYASLYEQVILDVKNGTWTNVPREMSIRNGLIELGGSDDPFNPAVASLLSQKKVQTPDLGSISVYDLIMTRQKQFATNSFEPFVGPLKNQSGGVMVKAGERLNVNDRPVMTWLLDNVKTVR